MSLSYTYCTVPASSFNKYLVVPFTVEDKELIYSFLPALWYFSLWLYHDSFNQVPENGHTDCL